MADDTLLEFPCAYPVKAFGANRPGFADHVRALLTPVIGSVDDSAVDVRPSRGDRYLAVTIHFTAQSKAQVDAVYEALTADPQVMMSL